VNQLEGLSVLLAGIGVVAVAIKTGQLVWVFIGIAAAAAYVLLRH